MLDVIRIGDENAGDGGGRWLGEAVSPGDKHFAFTNNNKNHHLPESLRDEEDLIFFLGEDAEEGE